MSLTLFRFWKSHQFAISPVHWIVATSKRKSLPLSWVSSPSIHYKRIILLDIYMECILGPLYVISFRHVQPNQFNISIKKLKTITMHTGFSWTMGLVGWAWWVDDSQRAGPRGKISVHGSTHGHCPLGLCGARLMSHV